MIAIKIHHPNSVVQNANAPAMICNRPESATFPLFASKKEPARHPKAMTKVKKIMKKTMLVRSEQMRKIKHMMPIATKKNAKVHVSVRFTK
jgi:hypothetical protein